MFNIVYVGSEGALEIRGDALFHFLRPKTRVIPEDADDGDVDIGKNIGRHGHDGGSAQDGDQHSHYEKSIRATESQPDDPHSLFPRNARSEGGQNLPGVEAPVASVYIGGLAYRCYHVY